MKPRVWVPLLSAATLLSFSASLQAAGDGPYLYQRAGFTGKGVAVELETAVGTRETRPLGEQGLEQGLRVRVGLTDRVSLEAWGGALIDTNQGGLHGGAFSADASVIVLRQQAQWIDLNVSAGYMLDFQGVSVPHIRVAAGHDFGPVNITLSGRGELPLSEDRDAVDVLMGAAASYAISNRLRVGLEVVGEDLEGFWDPEEAEGGARLAMGPTMWLARGGHFELKANAGAVVSATTSLAPGSDTGEDGSESGSEGGVGFLGRVAIGYVF